MQSSPLPQTGPRWLSWALVAGVTVLVLAPWWRNQGYVRSFFDYGLVVGGVGRIETGQRPYVDFVSPAQAGWYFINAIAEKLGGGTFQGMTMGGAACIVISLAGLLGMLSRRWPLPAAALVAGALVCATVSQHTLWWYNPWGVVLLAVVAWAGAVAPVLRREDRGWHALVFAALFLGGINKINMQLMALMLAWAWAVRAGLTGRSGWGRVLLTMLFYLAGIALPVLAEMAWTGASAAGWWHNVIGLPAASRSGLALQAFDPKYLFVPFNDYYAALALPQVGLVGVIMTLLTVAAILRRTWREAGWVEKILPVGCGAVALLGGVVLLATNMDIAYIGLGGWIALLVALWLGYGLPARGPWFHFGLVVPAVLVGAVAWYSAWTGQRSQFGHSGSPRSDYVDAGTAGPDFAYLRGTLMPPETVASLREMAAWRQALPPDRQAGHFFGPGTEWAARIWPAMRTPGVPISVFRQAGNSDGREEVNRLTEALRTRTIKEITVAQVVDYWESGPGTLLEHRYARRALGKIFSVYGALPGAGVSGSPVWFTQAFGGNADSRHLVSEADFQPRDSWHLFLGVREGRGTMELTVPSNRLQGEVVVRRLAGAARLPAAADFVVYAQANPEARYERWRQRVELPADQDETVVPYAIDSSGLPAAFTVEIPAESTGLISAGWLGPRILHSGLTGPDEPAWFFHGEAPTTELDERALSALLGEGWRPEQALMRHGRVGENGIELSPGGEIWLQARGFVTQLSGRATALGAWEAHRPPFVRGMWYRGGRLEVYTQMQVRDGDRSADFNTWCSEPGGWLVIAVDPTVGAPPVLIRVNTVNAAP